MSRWYEIKEKNIDDIEIDKDEISFYAGYDDQGSDYVYMKVAFLLKFLKDNKLIN